MTTSLIFASCAAATALISSSGIETPAKPRSPVMATLSGVLGANTDVPADCADDSVSTSRRRPVRVLTIAGRVRTNFRYCAASCFTAAVASVPRPGCSPWLAWLATAGGIPLAPRRQVEQDAGEQDRRLPVEQRVVDLRVVGGLARLQSLDDVHHPQRTGPVEQDGMQATDAFLELRLRAGTRQHHALDVILHVDVVGLHPDGVRELQRHRGQLAAEHRDQGQSTGVVTLHATCRSRLDDSPGVPAGSATRRASALPASPGGGTGRPGRSTPSCAAMPRIHGH